MSKLTHAKSFGDLVVYQKARAVAKAIFEMMRIWINRAEPFCGTVPYTIGESAAETLVPDD